MRNCIAASTCVVLAACGNTPSINDNPVPPSSKKPTARERETAFDMECAVVNSGRPIDHPIAYFGLRWANCREKGSSDTRVYVLPYRVLNSPCKDVGIPVGAKIVSIAGCAIDNTRRGQEVINDISPRTRVAVRYEFMAEEKSVGVNVGSVVLSPETRAKLVNPIRGECQTINKYEP